VSADFGVVYVDARRRLRGVAESLIAGPQSPAGRVQGLPLITAEPFALIIWWEHTD
jgi:hypothetical protein